VRRFELKEVGEALLYAAEGGQALHVFPQIASIAAKKTTPGVFKRSHFWGHLFDLDKDRLIKTARQLGVRVIEIDREDTPRQHIDLCGQPLNRALARCVAGPE
jgi:hypothetical protein